MLSEISQSLKANTAHEVSKVIKLAETKNGCCRGVGGGGQQREGWGGCC